MIKKAPKKVRKAGTYYRTKAQKKHEDFSVRGESQRGYDRSAMDAKPIEYSTNGDKI